MCVHMNADNKYNIYVTMVHETDEIARFRVNNMVMEPRDVHATLTHEQLGKEALVDLQSNGGYKHLHEGNINVIVARFDADRKIISA